MSENSLDNKKSAYLTDDNMCEIKRWLNDSRQTEIPKVMDSFLRSMDDKIRLSFKFLVIKRCEDLMRLLGFISKAETRLFNEAMVNDLPADVLVIRYNQAISNFSYFMEVMRRVDSQNVNTESAEMTELVKRIKAMSPNEVRLLKNTIMQTEQNIKSVESPVQHIGDTPADSESKVKTYKLKKPKKLN